MNLFGESVFKKESRYMLSKAQPFGIPLDNRSLFTKVDWSMWVATFDENSFQDITSWVYKFVDETPDRVPFTDWYWTNTGHQKGFQARPVVGGIFLKMIF